MRNCKQKIPSLIASMVSDQIKKLQQILLLEKEFCDQIPALLDTWAHLRTIDMQETNLGQFVRDMAIMTGSTAEGTMSARMLCGCKLDLEMDIMFQVGSIPELVQAILLQPLNPPQPGFFLFNSISTLLKCFGPKVSSKFQEMCEELDVNSESAASSYLAKIIAKEMLKFQDQSKMVENIVGGLLRLDPSEVKLDYKSTINGPAVTLEFLVLASEKELMQLSIDIVGCVHLDSWPKEAFGFTKRKRNWPPDDVIQSIVSKGCHIVPKPVVEPESASVQTRDSESDTATTAETTGQEWRLSFSVAEKELAFIQSQEQRSCYYIVKVLFYTWLKFEVDGQSIPSYAVKTIMLWALEERPTEIWSDMDLLQENVRYLLTTLRCCLDNGKVPHYFIPEINILKNISGDHLREASKIVVGLEANPFNNLPSLEKIDKVVDILSDLSAKTSLIKTILEVYVACNAFQKLEDKGKQ